VENGSFVSGMSGLTARQRLFVNEYLIDFNATQAAIRAKYSAKTASRIGPELLGKTCVSEAISNAMKERGRRTEITADMVLRRWWELANADVNELIQYRRECCDSCWGEMQPTNVAPNPECPICHGEGIGRMFVADTRNLKGAGLMLYNGVKQTKDGLEIKIQDRSKALENVARHIGMFVDRKDASEGGSLTDVLADAIAKLPG
jgi:phage terminase small subunit